MNTIVIDASVAVKWMVQEPDSAAARSLWGDNFQCVAPDFILVEATNATLKKVRHKNFTQEQGAELIGNLYRLPLTFCPANKMLKAAWILGAEFNQSIYDCLYLALAIAYDCPLVTADKNFYNAISKTSFNKYVAYLPTFVNTN